MVIALEKQNCNQMPEFSNWRNSDENDIFESVQVWKWDFMQENGHSTNIR